MISTERLDEIFLHTLPPDFRRVPLEMLPIMDCPNCDHIHNKDDGHCYMFRKKPEGDRCGQFKKDEIKSLKQLYFSKDQGLFGDGKCPSCNNSSGHGHPPGDVKGLRCCGECKHVWVFEEK